MGQTRTRNAAYSGKDGHGSARHQVTSDEDQSSGQEDATQANDAMGIDALRTELQSDQQRFREMIFRRDVGEVGVLLLLVPLWFILGAWASVIWTWYLTVPVLIWVAGFMLVYRYRHKHPPGGSEEPLLECAKRALSDVEAQIWLLKNVFWWYVLPPTLSLMTFFAHTNWQLAGNWWETSLLTIGSGLFLSVIYRWVCSLNQRAVREQLEPRRDKLLEIIALLDKDPGDGDSHKLTELVATLLAANPGSGCNANRDVPIRPPSLSRTVIGLTSFVVIMAGVMLIVDLMGHGSESLTGAVPSPVEPEFHDVSSFSEGDIDQVDAWLEQQAELSKYPSLSVAVVRDGEIVYLKSFGFEDISERRKATPQTRYHVASVTKAFTASLAVILHDRGVVDLDQPVAKYLPEDVAISTTPEVGAKITLRHLASHTSGLPRGIPGRVQSVEGWYDLEPQRLYDHLANVSLESDPGTEELYSNLGFGLLGHALECAADKPFDQLLKETICEPLQLERTAIPTDDTLHTATGYEGSSWRFERSHSLRGRLAGSGGLVTTVDDLAKFLAAQMEPGVFSREALDLLHTESILADGSPSGRALGWSVRSRPAVGPILKKNGGRSNCDAWIGFAPEHRVGVAVVTNCGGPDVDDMGYWLLERSVPRKLVLQDGFAKVAPFTGVRWEGERSIVRVKNEWSPLVSIDGIPVERIIEFAEKEYGAKARKRFAEDLVEVLFKMDHTPDWEVTLGLKTSDGPVEHVKIRMTEENRNLLRK